MEEPGIHVLADGGKCEAEEPAVTTSGAGLQQVKVVLFALDGAFGTGTSIDVQLPEITVSGDVRVQAIVIFGISIDNPAIG